MLKCQRISKNISDLDLAVINFLNEVTINLYVLCSSMINIICCNLYDTCNINNSGIDCA